MDLTVPKVEGLSFFNDQSQNLAEVIPGGPWLADDEDITRFPPERLAYFLKISKMNSIVFQLGTVFATWALIPIEFIYTMSRCCK